MTARMHNIDAIPKGKTVSDILATFAGIKGEIRIGEPNKECASCRKPFDTLRRPGRKIKKRYLQQDQIPIVFVYRVCGECYLLQQRGIAERESFLAAVEAYHMVTSMEGLS